MIQILYTVRMRKRIMKNNLPKSLRILLTCALAAAAALIALYTGFRLWGFGGMILAPILTVTARELCRGD